MDIQNTRFTTTAASPKAMLDPEICVFPIGRSCYKYGLVYSFFEENKQTGRATEIIYRTLTYVDENTIILSTPIPLTQHISTEDDCFMASTRNIAVTDFRPEYQNNLIFLNYYGEKFFVFRVDAAGDIDLNNIDQFLFPFTPMSYGKASEMEVIETYNGSNRVYKIAYGLKHDAPTNQNPFIRISEYSYSEPIIQISNSEFDVNSFTNTSDENLIKGLEFSPDGNTLYYTYTAQTGLYTNTGYNLLANSSTPSSYYQFTEIELGRDGNMYFLYTDANEDGGVSILEFPNNPNPLNFHENVFPSVNKIYYSCDYPSDNYEVNRILLFAAQIDGSDYITDFDLDLDCCEDHILYQTWPANSEFDQNPNWVWDAGVLNNPFACQTSAYFDHDVIVPAGRTLTVRNMELRFAEGVKLSIEPGAKLILEYSTLGAINKCDDYRTWVGVEIQGQNDQSQVGGSE